MSALRGAEGGVRLSVQAQPGAARSELAGPYGDALRIRLAAPPVDGKANEELVRFLAELLERPRRAVRLVAGASGRRKVVAIDGIALADAARRLGMNPMS